MSWPVFLMVLLDLGASVRESRLYELNKQFAVLSVWKPPLPDVATQAILEQIAEDPSQRRGVGTINTLLGNAGIQIPWYINMLQVISSAKRVCTDLFICYRTIYLYVYQLLMDRHLHLPISHDSFHFSLTHYCMI